jgi:alpha-tubulin suppressor-like RCC1 family protein
MQEVPKHDKAGQLYTWGSNESGQLGTDNDCDTITATPALVNTPSPVKFDWVEANGSHSLAVSGTNNPASHAIQMTVLCTVGVWVRLVD